jgi:transposase
VDRWVSRYAAQGIAGLSEQSRSHSQVPDSIRSRVLELAAAPPPGDTGLTRWTTRTLADHLRHADGVTVSNNYVSTALREAGISLTDSSQQRSGRGRQPEQLDVHFEVVVVDEPHASALRQRQTAAIRDILRWLRENAEEPDDDHKAD